MTNDIDLIEMFGNDYYSIGLFSSVSKDYIDPYPFDLVGFIFDLCFQIKHVYHYEANIMIINKIIESFIKGHLLDTLVYLYKPYDHDVAINEYHVDNYILFSEKLMELANEMTKLQYNTTECIIEIFNMINMFNVHHAITKLK